MNSLGSFATWRILKLARSGLFRENLYDGLACWRFMCYILLSPAGFRGHEYHYVCTIILTHSVLFISLFDDARQVLRTTQQRDLYLGSFIALLRPPKGNEDVYPQLVSLGNPSLLKTPQHLAPVEVLVSLYWQRKDRRYVSKSMKAALRTDNPPFCQTTLWTLVMFPPVSMPTVEDVFV